MRLIEWKHRNDNRWNGDVESIGFSCFRFKKSVSFRMRCEFTEETKEEKHSDRKKLSFRRRCARLRRMGHDHYGTKHWWSCAIICVHSMLMIASHLGGMWLEKPDGTARKINREKLWLFFFQFRCVVPTRALGLCVCSLTSLDNFGPVCVCVGWISRWFLAWLAFIFRFSFGWSAHATLTLTQFGIHISNRNSSKLAFLCTTEAGFVFCLLDLSLL